MGYSKDLQERELEISIMFSVSSEQEKMFNRFEKYVTDGLSKNRKQN